MRQVWRQPGKPERYQISGFRGDLMRVGSCEGKVCTTREGRVSTLRRVDYRYINNNNIPKFLASGGGTVCADPYAAALAQWTARLSLSFAKAMQPGSGKWEKKCVMGGEQVNGSVTIIVQ